MRPYKNLTWERVCDLHDPTECMYCTVCVKEPSLPGRPSKRRKGIYIMIDCVVDPKLDGRYCRLAWPVSQQHKFMLLVMTPSVIRVPMWSKDCWQFLWNDFKEGPVKGQLNSFKRMQCKISWIHLLWVEGGECIHLRRISLLAGRVVNSITCQVGEIKLFLT